MNPTEKDPPSTLPVPSVTEEQLEQPILTEPLIRVKSATVDPLHRITVTDDETGVIYYLPLEAEYEDPGDLEYPLLVKSGTEVPLDRPPPYRSDNETGDLIFFREEATLEEWEKYRVWLQETAKWRRHPHDEVATLNGELISVNDVATLSRGEWVRDNILHYVFKSLNTIMGVADPLVAFFPSFFFTKLYQEGNRDPSRVGTYSYSGVATWTKKLLRGTPIDQMNTIVFLFNEERAHWICFAIFMDLKIIQAFDSTGCACAEHLKNLYRWLHKTMEIEGKPMNPAEWCLYGTRADSPRQREHDCGIYAVLFGLCVSMRLPVSLLSRQRIAASRVILLCHLVDIQPDKAEPLGAIDQYKPEPRDPDAPTLLDLLTGSPGTPSRESAMLDLMTPPPQDTPSQAMDGIPAVLDLMTPPPKSEGVLDLITPEKKTRSAKADSVTLPTNRQLNLEENESTEGTTGASKATDPNSTPNAGDDGGAKDDQDTAKTTGSGDGSSQRNTGIGANDTSGDGGYDDGNGADDGDKKDSTPPTPPNTKNDEKEEEEEDDEATETDDDNAGSDDDDKRVDDAVADAGDKVASVSGTILPFLDHTGITKKNHLLYTKALEVHSMRDSKANRLNLKKRKDNFQKSWTN